MSKKFVFNPLRVAVILITLLLVFGIAGFALAANSWTVDDDFADNTGCNTTTFQCKTIQAAIDAASAGDTISVAAGTYHEQVSINKPLTVTGEDSAVLDGTGLTPTWTTGVKIRSGNVTFNNIDVTNYTQDGITAYDNIDMPNLHITNVKVSNIQPGYWGFGIYVGYESEGFEYSPPDLSGHLDFSGLLIEGNEITNVHSSALVVQSLTGTPGTLVVRNNYIHDNTTNSGIWIDCARNLLIEDNTVVNNKWGIEFSAIPEFDNPDQQNGPYSPKDIILRENIVTGNANQGIILYQAWPSTFEISGNDISGNVTEIENQLTDTLDASGNWLGSNDPATVAAALVGNVDYTPWLDSGTDTSADPGFQGDFSALWVDDDSPQTGTSGRIQEGVNTVSGSTVNVAAGLYTENILIDKTMELAGSGVGSTTIIPAVSLPNPCSGSSLCGSPTAASNIILVQANDVIIHDMTLDGDNPSLISGIVRNGADVDARNGIIDNYYAGVWIGTEVYNTAIKNIYLRGLYAASGGNGYNFHENAVTNIAGDYASIGIFIYGGSGNVITNTVSYANDAISANHSKGIQFLNNNITFSGSGVHTDNAGDAGGSADVIKDNTVSDCTTDGYGVWVFVPYIAPIVDHNTVTNCSVGLSYWGEGAPVTTSFTNNTVNGPSAAANSVGVYVTTDLISWGYKDASVIFDGNIIRDNETGIYLTADQQTWNPYPYEEKTINASFIHNQITGNTKGLDKGTSGTYNVAATPNWWGAACGPGPVGPGSGDTIVAGVPFSPWWGDSTGSYEVSEGSGGELIIPTGASAAQAQAVIDCAAGKTVMFESGGYEGGLTVNGAGTTIKINGCTIGHGSPAFTVNNDDVTILGPGILDGDGDSSPGVLVKEGADNLILQDLEIREWVDGVEVEGSVESFKLVGNWLHDNAGAGLKVDSLASLSGVVTIQGNLFKANVGNGIQNDGLNDPLAAEYNSWGSLAGPAAGDGISAQVDAEPFTYAELFMDMEPDTLAAVRAVAESTDFDIALKADAANLFGLAFKYTYDPTKLVLNTVTFDGDWVDRCASLSSVAGQVAYRCTLQAPGDTQWGATAGTIATFNFTASGGGLTGNGPWDAYIDIAHLTASTNAGAVGGVKVFVNNAGYGLPSSSERDITDADDGKITITGIAQYTGFIDLQGRAKDSGAVIDVFEGDAKPGTKLATATSSSSGKYTTDTLDSYLLTIGSTYYLNADSWLYLPTTPIASSDYLNSKELDTRPLTNLSMLVLLGGDATDDDGIDVYDASCIGSHYQSVVGVCGSSGWSDVNGDGVMDILDLVLMGGNYDATSSPWTP